MLKILKIVAHGYKKFKLSNITNIEINFDRDTHVILGTNGCGKSSLLDILLPKAHTKTFFEPNGFVDLVVTDGLTEYKLGYSKRGGHTFYTDPFRTENKSNQLNGSNIMNIQNELIESTFGLDNTSRDILQCKLGFVDMRPGNRKHMLSTLSPLDLDIFVDNAKIARKQLTAVDNQLSNLYDRSQRIITQLLPEEAYLKLVEHHKELKERENELITLRAGYASKLKMLIVTNKSTLRTTEEANKKFEEYRIRCWDIVNGQFKREVTNLDDEIVQLPVVIENYRKSIQRLDRSIVEINASIDTMEASLDSLETEDEDIISMLNSYQKQLEELPVLKDYIRDEQHDLCIGTAKDVSELCERFSDIGGSVMTNNMILALNDDIVNHTHKIREMQGDIAYSKTKREEIVEAFKSFTIPTVCPKADCELYLSYSTYKEESQTKVKDLDKHITEVEKSLEEHIVKLDEFRAAYEVQKACSGIVNQISKLMTDIPVLCIAVPIDKIRSFLNQGSYVISNRLNGFIKNSVLYRKRLLIEEEVEKLKRKMDLKARSVSISKSHIEKSLESENKKREEIFNLIDMYEKKIDERKEKLSRCMRRVSKKNNMGVLHDDIKLFREYTERCVEEELLQTTIKIIEDDIQRTGKMIRDIDATLTEQLSSRNRLDEIQDNIRELEPLKMKLGKVEKSLRELQLVYIRTFLNNLIDITNNFLEEVCSYDMVLRKITTDNIDFKFPALIDDHVALTDISEASIGQKTLIELCFTLALIVEKNMTCYPLFLDEIDRTLDEVHRIRTLEFLDKLIDKSIISQLMIVNHHSDLHTALIADCTVLDSANITLPTEYNTTSIITKLV